MALIVAPRDNVKKEIDSHLELAEGYLDHGLYQKAIEEYNAALLLDPESEKLWTDKLTIYAKLYDENNSKDVYSKYLSEAKQGLYLFPKNEQFILTVANLYIVKNDYRSAYRTLTKAVDGGLKSESVLKLQLETKYAFETKYMKYSEVKDCVNGYYAALNLDKWIYLDEKGLTVKFPAVAYAGPVGEDTIRFVTEKDSERNYLMDGDKVIQGFFGKIPVDAGVYSEGLIAIKFDKKYCYYNSIGDVQFDNAQYDFAGTFYKGTAAVKVNGKWHIIDTDGNYVDDEEYDDIVLNSDFTYLKKGVKTFKYAGDNKYTIIVNDKEIGKYDSVGVVTDDGLIAVRENGNWGFINLKGEFVIDPQFVDARSFSGGLAAVYDGSKWGFVDKDGILAIPYQFFDVGYFNKTGCCMVLTEQKVDDKTKKVTSTWQIISLYNTK